MEGGYAVTLNEVIKDLKNNNDITEEIYKVMATNEAQLFPLWGNKFAMYDPLVELNNNIYYFTPDGLYGFSYKIGKVAKINIAVPDDWKDRIVKYYFNERN